MDIFKFLGDLFGGRRREEEDERARAAAAARPTPAPTPAPTPLKRPEVNIPGLEQPQIEVPAVGSGPQPLRTLQAPPKPKFTPIEPETRNFAKDLYDHTARHLSSGQGGREAMENRFVRDIGLPVAAGAQNVATGLLGAAQWGAEKVIPGAKRVTDFQRKYSPDGKTAIDRMQSKTKEDSEAVGQTVSGLARVPDVVPLFGGIPLAQLATEGFLDPFGRINPFRGSTNRALRQVAGPTASAVASGVVQPAESDAERLQNAVLSGLVSSALSVIPGSDPTTGSMTKRAPQRTLFGGQGPTPDSLPAPEIHSEVGPSTSSAPDPNITRLNETISDNAGTGSNVVSESPTPTQDTPTQTTPTTTPDATTPPPSEATPLRTLEDDYYPEPPLDDSPDMTREEIREFNRQRDAEAAANSQAHYEWLVEGDRIEASQRQRKESFFKSIEELGIDVRDVPRQAEAAINELVELHQTKALTPEQIARKNQLLKSFGVLPEESGTISAVDPTTQGLIPNPANAIPEGGLPTIPPNILRQMEEAPR